MAIVDFPELKVLAPAGRLMALDVGAKTIGIATSDASRMLATPVTTLRRGKLATDLAAVHRLDGRSDNRRNQVHPEKLHGANGSARVCATN